MDTLFWIQCSPNVRIEHTSKKFFNKYLCKLVLYAPAGRLIESKDSIVNGLEYRRTIRRDYNYGGSWYNRQDQQLDNADADFLEFLRFARQTKLLGVKFRIEEPLIQVYCDTEDSLKEFVETHFQPNWQRKYIEAISVPANKEAAELLNTGVILRKTENGFRYKVMVKDGHYGIETKESIRQYLQGVGLDNAYMPRGFEEQLLKGQYLWSGYFYVNDIGLLSFLELIRPGMITNFHELVVQPHK